MTETPAHKYVTLSHGRTRYLEAGDDGPTVLLLHGAGYLSNADNWLSSIGGLAEGHRVIAPDCLNWGLGDPFQREFSFAYLVDFVREFQDVLGIERSHVVGHSMGGWLASLLAYESPNRVDRLVLVASGGMAKRNLATMVNFTPPPEETMRETARSRALSAGLDPDALADAYAAHLTRPEVVEAFAGVMRHMTDPETRNRYHMARRLPFIKAPTLILWGTADATNDIALGEETHALIEGSRFLTFEGAGHNLPGERTPEFVAAVREFLAS
jgi:pimeloyl-ACP methyl ester carboxylesterase